MWTRRRRWSIPSLAAAAAVVVTATTLVPGPARAAVSCLPASAEKVAVPGDVDGDGLADTVVGMPSEADSQGYGGTFDFFRSSAPPQRVTGGSVGLSESGTFGASVAVVDIDGDTCRDLMVGHPGATASDYGEVVFLRGAANGFDNRTQGDALQGPPLAGSSFGASVAAARRPGVDIVDYWVGAPLATVDGHVAAGLVYHFVADSSGNQIYVDEISFADIPGAGVRSGDRFGEVVSALPGGVVVGVPRRSVAGLAGAGAVVVMQQSDPSGVSAEVFTQNSAGVAGVAEVGDGFGAAVSATGGILIAGAPGEDLGTTADAGLAQVWHPSTTGFRPVIALQQGARGLPGKPERGDRFAAAVALAQRGTCPTIAIGSPGEDLGRVRDAGAVTLVDSAPHMTGCAHPAWLQQGAALRGEPEMGDHFGAALTSQIAAPDGKRLRLASDLVIGVPGENGGAGIAQLHHLRGSTPDPAALRVIPAHPNARAFGAVLASLG